jgi:hypothetical protein
MSLRESVILFLKGGPMRNGIALFSKHFDDPMFLRLCKMNPSANRPLLEKQLAKKAGLSDAEFKTIKNEKNRKQTVPLEPKTDKADKEQTILPQTKPTNFKKLRDEYPFIARPDCPPEFHHLVSLKITAYHQYVDGHKQLFDARDNADCLEKARFVVENYKQNQLIHDELAYYAKHKAILGLHPVFASYKNIARLRSMNIVQLVKKEAAVRHNIWRIEDEIKKGDKPHLLSKRQQQLSCKQMELAELKRLLDTNE